MAFGYGDALMFSSWYVEHGPSVNAAKIIFVRFINTNKRNLETIFKDNDNVSLTDEVNP